MEEEKSKIEGYRKIGIAMGAITALSVKETIDFRTAIIIAVIAVIGIVCQGVLDWRKIKNV